MTDLNNYNLENFKRDAQLIFLLEIEKLSPGYIDKNFIEPVLNGDAVKKEMFFDILSTSDDQVENVYLLLKKLIDANKSAELLKEVKGKYFYKRVSERLTSDEKIDELIQKEAHDNVLKKYNSFYENYEKAYGFNHAKELVLQNIKINEFLKSGLKQLPLELFNQTLEEYGLKVLKNFSFESLYKIMKISESINGKEETALAYNVLFNEKVKLIKEERETSRQEYLKTYSDSFTYEDVQSLCDVFKEFDKGDKDFNLLSAWVNMAIIIPSDSLMSSIVKNYGNKVLPENNFAVAMFDSLTVSTNFSNFKKILYKKNSDMFSNIKEPVLKSNKKSLSKGMTILLAIDRNINTVEYKTKEKIEEWKKEIRSNYGLEIIKDAFERDVFSERENINILEKHAFESINSIFNKYTPNVYNLKTFQSEIGLNDEILLRMLNLSVTLTKSLNYEKNQVLKGSHNIFLFKDSFSVLKEFLNSDFAYENKEKVVESFVYDLLNKNSQIYLNYLLQGMGLGLIPEKYKNLIYEKSNDNFEIILNSSENDNYSLHKVISETEKEKHYLLGLSILNYNKDVEEKITDFMEEFKMRKSLKQDVLDNKSELQYKYQNRSIKKF